MEFAHLRLLMLALAAAALLLLAVGSACAENSDLITSLPGLETLPSFPMFAFSHFFVLDVPAATLSLHSLRLRSLRFRYSGYITVDESHGRNLYYFFAESQGNPATDPVVLWMQGGPGEMNYPSIKICASVTQLLVCRLFVFDWHAC